MNLAWLLAGPGNLRQSRVFLVILAVLLLLAGAGVVTDASHAVTAMTLEACGWLLVALGLSRLALTVLAAGGGAPSLVAVQGVVFILLGVAVAEFPAASETAVPWLLGGTLLVNGTYQLLSALVIRFPRWGWYLASGLLHLALGGLVFLQWRLAAHWVVPILLGCGFSIFALSALRTAFRLGGYGPGRAGWSPERAALWYRDFHMPRRYRQHHLPGAVQAPPEVGQPHGELLVHVWTPVGVARLDRNPNLVSRYVAARNQEGRFTVGHAALEMAPDIYISHRDGDPDAFEGAAEVWQTLRARDVPGLFLPSFAGEVAGSMEPSVTVRFRNFKEGQLRTFWAVYRQVAVYNFTNRNCSVAVALALEAALMGSMAGPRQVRTLLGLLLNRDLWVAHFIRLKAGEMVWTPGMILDYALALQRVVEPG